MTADPIIVRVQGGELWLSEEEAISVRQQISSGLAHQGPTELHPDAVFRIYISRKAGAIMTPNKRAAHAVHAALIAVGAHPSTKVVVLDKGPTEIVKMRTVVHDAGHTELEPGTLTAGTNWPEDSQPMPPKVEPVTEPDYGPELMADDPFVVEEQG